MQLTRLAELRKKCNMTQNELAKAVGTTKQSIWNYESGHREPSLQMLINLCRYFEVSSDYMLGLTDVAINEQIEAEKTKNLTKQITKMKEDVQNLLNNWR